MHTIETAEIRFERRLMEETTRLEMKIESVRSDLIKWMFIFWIGQFASIVGILTAILFAFFKR